MAEYIVIGFAGQGTARSVLKQLQEDSAMELNIGACSIAERSASGELNVNATHPETVEVAASGAFAGGLAGVLLGLAAANPVAGILLGSTIGGLAGVVLEDTDETALEDDFAAKIVDHIPPDSSAICFLFWDEPWDYVPDSVQNIVDAAGGKVLRTTLSAKDEAELKSKLKVV